MAFALTGARVFDGEAFLGDAAVVVDGRRVLAVVQADEIAEDFTRIDLHGGVLAPGFIDVQVNGGGGALLNNVPSLEVVRQIAHSHRMFGTVGLLPTVITDAAEVTASAIAAVREACRQAVPGVLGIHVEGPFLDPVRRGAHDPSFIRPLSDADITMLGGADCGVVMLTLAPNKVSPAQISQLVQRGIRVSLGHAEANHDECRAALAAGASAFTHLFNAMSQLSGREPGMVGAALGDQDSFIGVIADGFHVHDAALTLAFNATSRSRFMLVTDAMPPAAGGPDHFTLQGRTVRRVDNRLQLADGTLAGSNLTMDAAVRHCVNQLGLPLADALKMASRNPARFLGCESDLGGIAPGMLASLVHLDDNLNVTQTWIEGQ